MSAKGHLRLLKVKGGGESLTGCFQRTAYAFLHDVRAVFSGFLCITALTNCLKHDAFSSW